MMNLLLFRTVTPTAPAPVVPVESRRPIWRPEPEPHRLADFLETHPHLRFRTVAPPPPPTPTTPPVVTTWQQPSLRSATSVGIVATGGTSISMTPADLTVSGRTDITEFLVISLDAGRWA